MSAFKLVFPNGEHAEIDLPEGETRIGSAPGNGIVVNRLLAHHASVVREPHGLMLRVAGGSGGAHVNTQAVREMAFLRDGDLIDLNGVLIRVQATAGAAAPAPAAARDEMATRVRQIPPRLALRGVTGPYFGKVVPLKARLLIGRGSDCDLVLDESEMSRHHAVIEYSGGGLNLRDLGSVNGTFVNGTRVRDTALKVGDQIGFDRNRFLIENLAADGKPAVTAPPPSAAQNAAPRRSPLIWLLPLLLIAAAAVAWMLLRR